MWKKSPGEGSSMNDTWETSPKTVVKKTSLRSRRKLPFSENVKKSRAEILKQEILKEVREVCDTDINTSDSLTPRRNTPLSERQQIALLCKLSVTDSPSGSNPLEEDQSESNYQKRNERGETPLHLAVIKGDLNKTRKLLKQGAGVNSTDFAMKFDQHSVVKSKFLLPTCNSFQESCRNTLLTGLDQGVRSSPVQKSSRKEQKLSRMEQHV